MRTLGVVDDAEKWIRTTTEDAYAHLHHLPSTPARDLLEYLAQQLMERTH
jgi:geranylgeranyl pyrophosphate synthase